MAKCRPKLSPMCRLFGNCRARTGTQYSAASYQRALCGMWLPTRLATSARQNGGAGGRRCSSFTTLRLSMLRPGRKKAARNAPKCHYSRLYRAGGIVRVVAQPIQDMSAVSITHKTVGIRLPRLWCGAIGWRTKLSIKSHQVQSSNTSPHPQFRCIGMHIGRCRLDLYRS